jgi:hypothetical protein
MMRLVAHPRARLLLVALLLLLALGLGWHLVGAEHHVGMDALGACIAALVVLGGVLPSPPARRWALRATAVLPPGRLDADVPVPAGRHPPDLGTVLRL